MLEQLKEEVKERDISLGVIMVVTGILIWFLPKFAAISLIVYGVIQTFWKKVDKIEEHHHHHHHHNYKPRKKAPRKKNA